MLRDVDKIRLLQFAFVAAMTTITIAWWLWRRSREKRALAQANLAATMLSHAEACRLFLEAEAAWTFNLAHDTPRQANQALLRLRQIVVNIQTQAQHLRRDPPSDRLIGTIDALCAAYTNRKNHQWGTLGTALNSRAEEEIANLRAQLEAERAQFRVACQEAQLT